MAVAFKVVRAVQPQAAWGTKEGREEVMQQGQSCGSRRGKLLLQIITVMVDGSDISMHYHKQKSSEDG